LDGVNGTGELDQHAVAGGLDQPPAVARNRRRQHLVPERPNPRPGSLLVGPHQPRMAHHISGEDRGKSAQNAPFGHWPSR